jgi:rhamnose transport system permease protein
MIRRAIFSREAVLCCLFAAIFAAFTVFTEGFMDWFSLLERARYWVIPGMIAVPMTLIITTAGIDLSVGSIVAMCGIILGLLYSDAHWPIFFAAVAAVAVGVGAGAFNGGVSSYLRIPPLVVTLATMAMFRGVAMGLSKARTVSNFSESFLWISQGDAFKLPLGGGETAFAPVPVIALIAVVLAGWVLMRRSWIGRFTECIGENPTAAAFAGIDVRRMTFWLYTGCGAVCGVAALFNTALYATAKADAAMGLELDAIACVVIGGTRISGGEGSVIGSLLGLLIIGILRYGLEMAGIKSQYVVIFVGALLIITAILNEWLARVRARGVR